MKTGAPARSPGTATPPEGTIAKVIDRATPGPHQIFGQVVDEATGGPVRGASYAVISSTGAVVAHGQTDWQGGFHHRVQPGRYRLRLGDGVRPPLHEVHGLVVDTTGRPIEGASYDILDVGGRVVASGKTDAEGRVRKGVPQGKYRLRVTSDPELRQLKAQVPIRLSFRSLDEAKEWLARNRIEVTVDGKPVPCGASAERGGRVVVQFRVPPGEHEVVVSSVEHGSGGAPLRIVYLSQKIAASR